MVGKIIGAATGHALPRRGGHVHARSAVAVQAHSDMALLRRRKGEMDDAFYDLGEALLRLRAPGVAEALGHANTYAMVRQEAGLAPAQVDELLEIVTHLKREDAERMGHGRAAVLARLAATTSAPELTPRPAKSNVSKRRAKAADVAPAAWKAVAASIEAKLHALGVETARVTVVAGALRIAGVPVDERALLKRAL